MRPTPASELVQRYTKLQFYTSDAGVKQLTYYHEELMILHP